MNALAVFSFQENHPVRVVMVDGEPWFIARCCPWWSPEHVS